MNTNNDYTRIISYPEYRKIPNGHPLDNNFLPVYIDKYDKIIKLDSRPNNINIKPDVSINEKIGTNRKKLKETDVKGNPSNKNVSTKLLEVKEYLGYSKYERRYFNT